MAAPRDDEVHGDHRHLEGEEGDVVCHGASGDGVAKGLQALADHDQEAVHEHREHLDAL